MIVVMTRHDSRPLAPIVHEKSVTPLEVMATIV